MKIAEQFRKNWYGLLALVVLCVIGWFNLRSADFYSGDAFHRAQLVWFMVGVIVAGVIAVLDLRTIERFSYLVFGGLILLLVLTALFGKEVNNSRRWLSVGTMVIQPSEFMKIGMILALAKFVQRTKGAEAYTMANLAKPFLLILFPFSLIIIQPDLGTALILLFIATSIVFFEGVRLRTFVMLIGIVGLTVPVAWQFELIEGYQKDRIVLWLMEEELDPTVEEEKRILDKNLQSEQAKWAIGRGRVTGTGLMEGVRSRLKYLPEIHNDFILAIYAEEKGFVGCIFLLFLYFSVIVWGLSVVSNAREKFGALIAVGVAGMVFWQVIVNVGMVTGMLPVVGSQLPVLSYGGSSLLTTFMGFGLLLNVSVSRVKIV